MRVFLLCLILAAPAFAQDGEDAAHRADRARTQALNARAATAVAKHNAGNAARQDDYRAARAAYEEEMRRWRQRVAACNGGDWSACDR